MFNKVWQGFSRCHVAFVRKRILDVEFIAFCEGLEVPGRLLAGRVTTEYSMSRHRFLCISAGFRSRQGFPGHDKAFSGSVS